MRLSLVTFSLLLLTLRELLSTASPLSLLLSSSSSPSSSSSASSSSGSSLSSELNIAGNGRPGTRTRAFNYLEGPRFSYEPPGGFLHYSNDSGISIHCSAVGSPQPQIFWIVSGPKESSFWLSKQRAGRVEFIREPLRNGSLVFPPFSASSYRADVHTAVYRCVAENTVGSIVSRAVHLRAVLNHYYEVSVYDEFVIRGNTGVLKCQIPSFVADYVSVISWIKGRGPEIVGHGEKYSVFPTGELYIRNVGISDASSKYRCKTRHKLTGETKISDSQGSLILSEPSNNVPPRITNTKSVLIVKEGAESLEIPCAADGWPIPHYKWYKIDSSQRNAPKMLNAINGDRRFHERSGSLTIRHIQVEDTGKYYCIASNGVGEARAYTDLIVSQPLAVLVEPQSLIVEQFQSVSINCSTSGHPRDQVVWLHNSQMIFPDNHDIRIQDYGFQSTLAINHLSAKDSGMYQCSLQNDIGDSAQSSIQIGFGDVEPFFLETFEAQVVNIGERVSLRCIATGSPLPQITWKLDGRSLEEMRQNEMDSQTLSTAMWGDYVLIGKGQVVSHVNLSVESVFDGGTFECTGSNMAGIVQHKAEIRVFGPPALRKLDNTTAIATKSIYLPCYSLGNKSSSIVWRKDGKLLPFNHRQRIHTNGTLEITNLDKHIDSGSYSCSLIPVNHTEITNYPQRNMTLSVKVPPVIEDFKFGKGLQAGMRTRISCNIASGDEPISIAWAKDGKVLRTGKDIVLSKSDQFSLTVIIESLTSAHNGNYTCIASNEAASISQTTTLTINEPPIWVIEPKDSKALEGSTKIINCVSRGHPNPQITWKRLITNGAISPVDQEYQLIRSGPHYQVYENGSLRITDIQISDGGTYLCQATNGIGPGLSSAIMLTVNVPVRFETWDKSENLRVRKGKRVEILCKAIGDAPIKIQWKRRKLSSFPQVRYDFIEEGIANGLLSRMRITEASREDSDEFKCFAENPFGVDVKSIFLSVEEEPDPPTNLVVESKSSRAIVLRWEQSYDGNSQIRYTIVNLNSTDSVGILSGEYNITISGNQTSAVLRNLHPYTNYEITLRSVNALGFSRLSTKLRVMTDEEAPGGPPTNVQASNRSSTSIQIDWFPPRKELIYGELKGYYIGYKMSNSSEHFMYKTVSSNGTDANNLHSLVLNKLKPFTGYLIILQAFNAAGAGPRSDAIVVVTKEAKPSAAPSGLSCKPLSSTSLKVTWDELPEAVSNGFLLGYKVAHQKEEVSGEEEEPQVKTEVIKPQSSSLVLHGLEPFTNYTIKVLGYNSVGDGPNSEDVLCRTEEDVPSAPAEIKAAQESPDTIIVSWKPPAQTNGAIKTYTVYRENNGKISLFTVPKHLLHNKANGLITGRKYNFWVKASTGVGEGPSSSIVSQTLSKLAQARIITFGDQIQKKIGDTVQLPCKAVGIPNPIIEWYFNGIPVSKIVSKDQPNLEQHRNGSLSISKLEEANEGNYSCHASNPLGRDLITYNLFLNINTADKKHQTPSLVVTGRTSESITLSWDNARPGKANPSSVYQIYYKTLNTESQWRRHVPNDEFTNKSFTIQNLQCGTEYQIYTTSHGGHKPDNGSNILSTTTLGRKPIQAPPSLFITRLNSSSVVLNLDTWDDGGCPILNYSIKWRMAHSSQWRSVQVTELKQKYLLGGLSTNFPYKVLVMMKNTAGTTVAEYELQTLPFITNIHRTPSDMLEASIDRSSTDDSFAPAIFAGILLLLLASLVVLVMLLVQRVVQKRLLNNNMNVTPTRMNTHPPKKFCRYDTNSEIDTTGSSELSVMNTSAERGKQPSLYQTTAATSHCGINSYQQLAIRYGTKEEQENEASIYSKLENHNKKTVAKQMVRVNMDEHGTPRYSVPKHSQFSLASANTLPKNYLKRNDNMTTTKTAMDISTGLNQADCVCCALLEPDCCHGEHWRSPCDFHTLDEENTATLILNSMLK